MPDRRRVVQPALRLWLPVGGGAQGDRRRGPRRAAVSAAGGPGYRPDEQDPCLPPAGRRRRYRGSQRTARLRRGPARLRHLPTHAGAPGYLQSQAADQQPAQGQGAGRVGHHCGRAPAAENRPQPVQPQLSGHQGRQARASAWHHPSGRGRMMFDTRPHWQAMRRNWRTQCLASLILPIAVVWFFHDRQGAYPEVALPLFIAGLLTLLLSVWRFRHFRQAVIEADAQQEAPDAEKAWTRLHHQQLLGLTHAKLPGWVGMLHYVCTLELTPLILLVLA